MKTICFIPTRKGSKGIPGKNIRMLGEKPLVCWILDTVLESGIADSVWLATDCDCMEALVKQRYTSSVSIFRRSEWGARDESPTIDVVLEFLNIYRQDEDCNFVLLQATSPFTTIQELRDLSKEIHKKEFTSFISCYRLKKFRWSENGLPLDYTLEFKPRRQIYTGLIVESGAFYVSRVQDILRTRQLISLPVKVIEVSMEGMIDIDEEEDWELGVYFAQKHQKKMKG